MKLTDAIEYATNGFNHFECPDGWHDCQAARAIALALLDPTPVTGEALVAMGWTGSDHHPVYRSPCYLDDECLTGIQVFHLSSEREKWKVNGIKVGPFATIGQVRMACLAFGIPIREDG